MKPLSQNPSNSTPLSEQEITELVKLIMERGVMVEHRLVNTTASQEAEHWTQKLLQDRKAWGEYLASTDVDLTHADTPEKGARYLREAIRQRNQGEKTDE